MYVGTNKYTEKERERAVVGFESPEVNHRFEGKTRIQPWWKCVEPVAWKGLAESG